MVRGPQKVTRTLPGRAGVGGSGRGESSNLTPREPQAKPLPDRRSCLGRKGSRSAPLGWPGLGQQAEEDASAGRPGAGTSPAWKESQGLAGEGLEPLCPPQVLCTCRSGGRSPSRPPQDWPPLQISASDPPHLLLTLVVSASSARLSPARAKLVLHPSLWPPPPVTSTTHVVPSSASALPLQASCPAPTSCPSLHPGNQRDRPSVPTSGRAELLGPLQPACLPWTRGLTCSQRRAPGSSHLPWTRELTCSQCLAGGSAPGSCSVFATD